MDQPRHIVSKLPLHPERKSVAEQPFPSRPAITRDASHLFRYRPRSFLVRATVAEPTCAKSIRPGRQVWSTPVCGTPATDIISSPHRLGPSTH